MSGNVEFVRRTMYNASTFEALSCYLLRRPRLALPDSIDKLILLVGEKRGSNRQMMHAEKEKTGIQVDRRRTCFLALVSASLDRRPQFLSTTLSSASICYVV
eukprot:TRINITY_DN70443_c0_g1_i1.p1 TRINITY_DN70443_c0_g1~~TRINITY_DN70443_c0_g1_i1.p1  ORF type:complete len:102 (-),score=10.14 TRINITY_DN70443_c0_g1_i1:546-851(-)